MWFRLRFGTDDSDTLAAIVGKSWTPEPNIASDPGQLYWRVADVGKLLRYRCPGQIVKNSNLPKRHVKDVLPPIIQNVCVGTCARLLTTDEMLQVIRKSLKGSSILADRLQALLTNTHILIRSHGQFFSPNIKSAPEVIPVDPAQCPEAVQFSNWSQHFCLAVMEQYRQIIASGQVIRVDDSTCDASSSKRSLEEDTEIKFAKLSKRHSTDEQDNEGCLIIDETNIKSEPIEDEIKNAPPLTSEPITIDQHLPTEPKTIAQLLPTEPNTNAPPLTSEQATIAQHLIRDADDIGHGQPMPKILDEIGCNQQLLMSGLSNEMGHREEKQTQTNHEETITLHCDPRTAGRSTPREQKTLQMVWTFTNDMPDVIEVKNQQGVYKFQMYCAKILRAPTIDIPQVK